MYSTLGITFSVLQKCNGSLPILNTQGVWSHKQHPDMLCDGLANIIYRLKSTSKDNILMKVHLQCVFSPIPQM